MFGAAEDFTVGLDAESLLNFGPQRFSKEDEAQRGPILERGLATVPELDGDAFALTTDPLRCLGYSQASMQLREEFAVPGTNVDPCLWMGCVEILPNEMRNNRMPSISSTSSGAG